MYDAEEATMKYQNKLSISLAAAAFCQASEIRSAFVVTPRSSFGQRRNRLIQAISETNNEEKAEQQQQQQQQQKNIFKRLSSNLKIAAAEGFGTRARNVGETMKIDDIVVPLCSNLEKRQSLAQRGVYPGVEYKICDITIDNNQQEEKSVSMRPAYPLRDYLERSDWPITVAVSEVPLWLSKTTYEAGTALGTLMLACTYLSIAAILASFIRIAVVPSESMEPSLQPGDIVLVTRSILPPKAGDVVFFNPPVELDDAIANSKVGRAAAAEKVQVVSTKGKQFLKRVVGVPGDKVGVWNSNPFVLLDDGTYRVYQTGQYSRPDVFSDESWNRVTPTINKNLHKEDTDSTRLARGEYFVAGDNGARSVDSRVWGPLKEKYLFGTVQWVISPINHFGSILPGEYVVEKELSINSH